MIALKAHRYGVQRKAGDRYTVKQSDYRVVTALGWASDAAPDPKPYPAPAAAEVELKPKRAYIRRDVVAEPEPVAPVVEAEKPKRTYHRKDMTATPSDE